MESGWLSEDIVCTDDAAGTEGSPKRKTHKCTIEWVCVWGGAVPYGSQRSQVRLRKGVTDLRNTGFAFNCNPKFIQLSTDRSNVKYGKRVTITRVAKVPNEYCVRCRPPGKEASHKPLKYECLTSAKKRECGNQRVEEETPLAVGRSQSGCIQQKKRAVDGGLLELKTHTLGASRKAITI